MKKYLIYNYVGNSFWGGTQKGFSEGFIYNDKILVFDSRLEAEDEVSINILPNYQGVFEIIEVFRNLE